MHCKSCETAIEEEIKSLNGIFNVQASHNKSNVITVYENEILSENEIKKAIKKAGYSTTKNSIGKFLSLGAMVIIMLYLSSNSLIGLNLLYLYLYFQIFLICTQLTLNFALLKFVL